MNKKIVVVILGIIIFLSACSFSSNELYVIPLVEYKTDLYDIVQANDIDSFLSLEMENEYVEVITLSQVVIIIPDSYNVLDNTTVYINFEINDYRICSENIELIYHELTTNKTMEFSCSTDISDEDVLKDSFLNEPLNIYIVLRYTDSDDKEVIDMKQYAIVEGSLLIYRR